MDYEKLKQFRNESDGFINDLGLIITKIDNGSAQGKIKMTKKHGNPIGSIHGGCLFSIADTLGGVAATSKGRIVTTVDGDIHYLNAAFVGDELFAEAKEIKTGKTLAVMYVKIYNQDKKLLTTSTMTYYYMSKEMDTEELLSRLKQMK
jgi:acyl-CoA thioesterase